MLSKRLKKDLLWCANNRMHEYNLNNREAGSILSTIDVLEKRLEAVEAPTFDAVWPWLDVQTKGQGVSEPDVRWILGLALVKIRRLLRDATLAEEKSDE